jgi:riboflavin kinase/FMN adenylyltransferase
MQELRLSSAAEAAWPASAVAIGNFDGVHRGHQALVRATVARARRTGGTAVVLTFEPHPAQVLGGRQAPSALTTPAQKRELLAALGCDALAVLPFTAEVAGMDPGAFAASVLVGRLAARHAVIGAGFRFGRGQAGDARKLADLGRELGFSVDAIPAVQEGGLAVSSSRVRDALGGGDVAAARRLLGRAYAVDGRVVAGDGRGRTLGLPTANLVPENEILPGRGVYAGRCRLAGEDWRPAVVNVGERPTFGGGALVLEAHLIDFAGDLYGLAPRLSFEERLREERRFPDTEALVRQIRDDIARARAVLSARPEGAV